MEAEVAVWNKWWSTKVFGDKTDQSLHSVTERYINCLKLPENGLLVPADWKPALSPNGVTCERHLRPGIPWIAAHDVRNPLSHYQVDGPNIGKERTRRSVIIPMTLPYDAITHGVFEVSAAGRPVKMDA